MIEFHCIGCGKEFKVSENNSGKKGKCPKCQTIITVPFSSENEIIFDQNELTCSDPSLQKLYDTVVPILDDKLKRHAILDRDALLFDIYTDDSKTRSQFIAVTSSSYESENDFFKGSFIIISHIGTINSADGALLALRMANLDPFTNISIDDNDKLAIRMVTHPTMDVGIISLTILKIALAADKLEELIFDWDLE
jgi:hypothetical protein